MAEVERAVLHEYPLPIAKCYERVVGAKDIHQRWDACRYLFEATLKYISCIGIAQYLRGDRGDERINGALSCLTRPSLGHWLNILRLVERYNSEKGSSLLPADFAAKSRDLTRMADAIHAMKEGAEGQGSRAESISAYHFLEAVVSYRNRTAGHGAPQPEHIRAVTPILEAGILEFLGRCDLLRRQALVYISEIRVERHSVVHAQYGLMGTTKVALPDFVTTKESALFGFDRTLFLCAPESTTPLLSLHPLVIFANEELFLLQQADPRSSVEYVCHHSGKAYSADRVFEDFREKMGSFFGESTRSVALDKEQAYKAALRVSLIDGVVQEEERRLLDDLRQQFGISPERARELEEIAQRDVPAPNAAAPSAAPAAASAPEPSKSRVRAGGDGTPRRLLFFPYASVRQGFWADLVSRLASSCHRRGFVFSMLAPDPETDYDAAGMTALLSGLERVSASLAPDLLVMAPPQSAGFMDLFTQWYAGARIPLLSVDTEFPDYEPFAAIGAARPPLVQVDNARGGRLAADILASAMKSPGDRPQVLVLPGLEAAPHSRFRVSGFKERFAELYPSGRCKVLPPGDFRREKARAVLESFFEDAEPSRFSGLFCCNDEMALGAYETLLRLNEASETRVSIPIVGFNYSMEMAQALRNDRSGLLAGTISQNLPVYVARVLDVAEGLLSGAESPDSRILVDPLEIRR